MKIYDWKNISAVLAKGLAVFWWIMLILMILGVPLELMVLFYDPPEGSLLAEIINYVEITRNFDKSIGYKVLMILQTLIIVPVVLTLIKRLGKLFFNFSQESLFTQENITLLDQITKLNLLLSLGSLNLLAFAIGILSWILVAVFRQGTELQEENDLTV